MKAGSFILFVCFVTCFISSGEAGVIHGTQLLVEQEVSDSTITEYITRLVDFRTRYACTDSNTASYQWIHNKFLEFGFTDVSYDTFPYSPPNVSCVRQWNVIAVKQGSLVPEKVLVIGGHYDSFADPLSGCDPDTLAPGADDNASGATAVLEAARVLVDEDEENASHQVMITAQLLIASPVFLWTEPGCFLDYLFPLFQLLTYHLLNSLIYGDFPGTE